MSFTDYFLKQLIVTER
jgi:hypothetical protein